MKAKRAKSGLDYIRGPNWQPLKKTRKGWQQYANRYAIKAGKRDGVTYTGVLCDTGPYIRVNIAANYKR